MKVVPYLIFAGTAEEAMNFYVESLGAKVQFINRFGDSPIPSTEDQKNQILHASFTIGESLVMTSDGKPGEKYSGNNISLSIDFTDVSEMKEKFDKVAEGGSITMPVQDTFWGATFGMLIDKFGISWMFNCDKKPQAVNKEAQDKTMEITV